MGTCWSTSCWLVLLTGVCFDRDKHSNLTGNFLLAAQLAHTVCYLYIFEESKLFVDQGAEGGDPDLETTVHGGVSGLCNS